MYYISTEYSDDLFTEWTSAWNKSKSLIDQGFDFSIWVDKHKVFQKIGSEYIIDIYDEYSPLCIDLVNLMQNAVKYDICIGG